MMGDEYAKLVLFNVTDRDGEKIRDKKVLDYIKRRLEVNARFSYSFRECIGVVHSEEHTSVELRGTDRPGLLSEICAVLADHRCNVVNAEIWTHNVRAESVIHVTDDLTGDEIKDLSRLATLKGLLCKVLKGSDGVKRVTTTLLPLGVTNRERRLHQIMLDDGDYERIERMGSGRSDGISRPSVYTIVTMRSKDRPKLLFDIVCTMTDMQYIVFHGLVNTGRKEPYQEFYILHIDRLPIGSETERERIKQYLQAAIERRTCEGLELELFADDRVELLSDSTRIFCENGLCASKGGKARDTFHFVDVAGNPVDLNLINSIRRQVGPSTL